MNILVVVDMQNDFIDGSSGNKRGTEYCSKGFGKDSEL